MAGLDPLGIALALIKRRIKGIVIEWLFFVLGIIFPQWMALKALIEQNAAQVRVAVKGQPEHIVDFTLEPVRPLPDRHERVKAGLTVWHGRLQTQALIVRQGIEMRHNLVTRRASHGEVIYRR